jgi:phytoene dehydrogenase-like protein
MFMFVFKMFSEGGISLPRGGIGAVGQALAKQLPAGQRCRGRWWWW